MYWVTVDGLERHWLRARVDAQFVEPSDCCATGFALKTENVTALTLNFADGECPVEKGKQLTVQIDGATITGPVVANDGSWTGQFIKTTNGWQIARSRL